MKNININNIEFVESVEVVMETITIPKIKVNTHKLDQIDSIERLEMDIHFGNRRFWKVHALGNGSFITEYNFMGWIYITCNMYFIRTGTNKHDLVSLRDMNVIENTYNDHALFSNKEDAELYCEYCKQNEIK